MGKHFKYHWEILRTIPRDVGNFIEFGRRRAQKEPLNFPSVGRGDGVPVGEPIVLSHAIAADKEEAILNVLTEEFLLNGSKINAYYIVSSSLISSDQMQTTIQPCWVEQVELAVEYAPA